MRYLLLLVSLFSYFIEVQAQENAPLTVNENISTTNHGGFLENKGQLINPNGVPLNNIFFVHNYHGFTVSITKHGLTFLMRKELASEKDEQKSKRFEPNLEYKEEELQKYGWNRVDMNLMGATILKKNISSFNAVHGSNNYYLPHCPDGIMNVKSYKHIYIENIYPNIDWELFDTDEGLKYNFILHPGADASQIVMDYEGANDLRLNVEKSILEVSTDLGRIEEGELLTYEESSKRPISSSYWVKSERQIGIRIEGDYNSSETIIIDPPLKNYWMTYFSGDFYDGPQAICVGPYSNVYMTGYTQSLTYPIFDDGSNSNFQGVYSGGFFDMTIAKFDNLGVRQWTDYYGGTDTESPTDIVCNHAGDVFLTGSTRSADFPIEDAGLNSNFQGILGNTGPGYDAFIVKFNASGEREWADFYGGVGSEQANAITTDFNDNIYVVGYTTSANFPIEDAGVNSDYIGSIQGNYSGFIVKFNASGEREWADFYGASGGVTGGNTYATDVTCDRFNNLYVSGTTNANNFPIEDAGVNSDFIGSIASFSDAFLIKFDPTGEREWADFYGGNYYEFDAKVTTDNSGSVYLCFNTLSTDIPLEDNGGYFNPVSAANISYNPPISDLFFIKFDVTGERVWATYFGGQDDETMHSVICDNLNNLYVVGETYSLDFPVLSKAASPNLLSEIRTSNGNPNSFLVNFDQNTDLIWSTNYCQSAAGSGVTNYANDVYVDTNCLTIYLTGELYDSGAVFYTPSVSTYSQAYNAYHDGFIFAFQQDSILADLGPDLTTCQEVLLQGPSQAGSYLWQDGSTDSLLLAAGPGTYTLTVNEGTCVEHSDTLIISPEDNLVELSSDTILCTAQSITLDPDSNGGTYLWQDGSTSATFIADSQGTYWVQVTNDNCIDSDTVEVTYDTTFADFTGSPLADCLPLFVSFNSLPMDSNDIISWAWDFGDGNSSSDQHPEHTFLSPGVFDISLSVTTENGCISDTAKLEYITVHPNPVANFNWLLSNDLSVEFTDLSQNATYWIWDFGDGASSNAQHPTHSYEIGEFSANLTVFSDFDCTDSISKIISIESDFNIFVPNSFTPDGDQSNNYFEVKSETIQELHIEVFNRWGELVWESHDINSGWDGSFNGRPVQDGIYIWKLKAYSIYGEFKELNGHVNVIR